MQIEPPRARLRLRPDTAELIANARFGIFRQRDVAAKDMENRRLGPVERVAEIQIDRPIPGQFRARFDLYHRPALGVAVDARREPVGALAFDAAEDRNRADDIVAAAIQRHRAAIDETVDVAIGPDPEHEHAPVHAADTLIDPRQPPGTGALEG